ncbi:MAG: thiamine pyrophosphate-binding protein [Anaerocolumna sp.]
MRIAEAVLKYLKENDVDYIFGVPAGTVSPLYDSMNDVKIQPVVAKNEGGAAYMAVRYASVTGKLGVCMGAGGVGANNMINGVADAMRSKAPVLFITGYVHRWQIGKGAIQELDTQDILKPVTKYSKTVLDENLVMKEVAHAVEIAHTLPMGPVHLSIPIDVQLAECLEEIPSVINDSINDLPIDLPLLKQACRIISDSEKGVILVGKGCRVMSDLVMQLSEHLQWPVITTPEGKGVVSSDFKLNLGTYGFASTDAADDYVNKESVTCLLVLGSSLGENATCNFSPALFKGKKSIHVDRDKKELGKVYETDVEICADIRKVIPCFLDNTKKAEDRGFIKPDFNKPVPSNLTSLSLMEFMEKLPGFMPKDTYYVSDLGEFMNFVFKYLPIPQGGDFEINLNYAAMGSGIAGVIGVQVAYTDRTVAVFAGDGDFFMNGMEILTAKEYNLPIIFIIINNAMLGFVEHGHQFLFGRAVPGFKQQRINISEMMSTWGINSIQIRSMNDMGNIYDLVKNPDGPVVIELITDGNEPAPNGDRLKSLQKH